MQFAGQIEGFMLAAGIDSCYLSCDDTSPAACIGNTLYAMLP